MTSRTTQRSKVHEGLFSARPAEVNGATINSVREPINLADRGPPIEIEEDQSSPLQLEHMLGYAGDYRKTVLAMPKREDLYIKSLGSLITIENMNDIHQQRFLRGHDMAVCCLAVSNSGRLIASGQLGTLNHKGHAAPVFLWDADSGRRLTVLRGLTGKVKSLSFSLDEQFLIGTDEEELCYIWDLTTGDTVYAQRQPGVISVSQFVHQELVNHDVAYELVLGIQSNLWQGLFTYDQMRMQWSLKLQAYQMPNNGGLSRSFLCLSPSWDHRYLYLGTTSAEMMVFDRVGRVFRACIPVCSNGVHEVLTLPDETVLCGGGDGSLVRIRGRDMAWQKVQEVKLDGSTIRSLTLSANEQEVVVGCSSGAIYRCMPNAINKEISFALVTVSNNSSVTSLAFPTSNGNGSFCFATATASGEVRLWDLTDYDCLSALRANKAGAVNCLHVVDSDRILSGWQDGSLRCSDREGKQLWYIPNAHRDGCTTIAAYIDPRGGPNTLQFIATGGGDGAVRIWKFTNRELITQYTEHRKGVAKVLIDVKSTNIVHSVGLDGSILSYDLKANRRIICHIVNTGIMADMTQRTLQEFELVTSDSLGRLMYWDIDYRDAVMNIQDPSAAATRSVIRTCQISPSGRFLAFAGDDKLLKVIDEETHQIVAVGRGHASPILTLCWTPDERQILTGAEDSCLGIWNFYLGGENARR